MFPKGLTFILFLCLQVLVLPVVSQIGYLDPYLSLQNTVIQDAEAIRVFRETSTNPVMVFEKTFFKAPTSMKTMMKKDFTKKRLFFSEYSADSSAYMERWENAYRETIYISQWRKNDLGLLLETAKSKQEGGRMVVHRTKYRYRIDKKERVKHLKAVSFVDHFSSSKRKTHVWFKYTKVDSVKREITFTRRGLRLLHWGRTINSYSHTNYLIKEDKKGKGTTQISEFEYDGFGRLTSKIVTNPKSVVVETNQYMDSILIEKRRLVTNDFGEQLSTWQYDAFGKLELHTMNYDSTIYEYNDMDSLKVVTLHKYKRNGDYISSYPLKNIIRQNGKIAKFTSMSLNGVITTQWYEYDSDGRLKVFKQELMKDNEVLELVTKRYQYDIRGNLSSMEIAYPQTGNEQRFYVEVDF